MKNLHFYVLFIDGVFSPRSNADLRFHRINAPTSKELNTLVATIGERVARYLECRGALPHEDGVSGWDSVGHKKSAFILLIPEIVFDQKS